MSVVAEDNYNDAYYNTQYHENDMGLSVTHDDMSAPQGGYGQRN